MKFFSRTISLIVLALLATALFPAITAAKESGTNQTQVAATINAQSITHSLAPDGAQPGVVRSSEQFRPANGRAYLRSKRAVFDGIVDAEGRVEVNRRARDATLGRNPPARSGTDENFSKYGASIRPSPTARSETANRSEATSIPSYNALDRIVDWRS
jgi:hypothetical protein